MSVSGVGSSPVLRWLQNYLSSAGSATGSPSSCGGPSSSNDTTSISQQAVQLNADQAPQATDPSQTSGLYGPQGHPHHHHGGGQGGGSFMDQLAQSIVTDLQKATGSGASAGSGSSTTGSASSSTTSGSFVAKLASEIANDVLAQYQQATGSTRQPRHRAAPHTRSTRSRRCVLGGHSRGLLTHSRSRGLPLHRSCQNTYVYRLENLLKFIAA